MSDAITIELKRCDKFKGSVSVLLLGSLLVWGAVGFLGESMGEQGPKGWGIPSVFQSKEKESLAVSVSHPQLLEPQVGAEVVHGKLHFAGIAEPGTHVIVFGDGAEMAMGIAGRNGKFGFDLEVRPPVPVEFSLAYYSAGGTKIGGEPDLRFSVVDGESPVAARFSVVRPVDKGLVVLGEWIIAGTGKPGSRVKLQLDRWQLGIADVHDDGTWTFPRTVNEMGVKRQLIAREIDGYADEIIAHSVTVVE